MNAKLSTKTIKSLLESVNYDLNKVSDHIYQRLVELANFGNFDAIDILNGLN